MTGLTRDISAVAAYVCAQKHPPLGAHVAMEILLPTFAKTASSMRLCARGRVLRVERDESRVGGFAVAGPGFELVEEE